LVHHLEQVIANAENNKTLVFVGTKKSADEIVAYLRRDGYPALGIHGDKAQGERDWVLAEFKSGRAPIMVATDVASRGIDVKDIKTVINYDFPNNNEDYVHRIGRTGRAGSKGTAITLFTSDSSRQAKELVHVLREANQFIDPKLAEMARYSGGGGGNSRYGYGGGRGRGRGGFSRGAGRTGANNMPVGDRRW